MSRQPTWQAVKGTLIHRCALAAAGKWLRVDDAASPAGWDGGRGEPELVAEARWMAQQLGLALEQHDDTLGWALVDSGGPYWAKTYDEYCRLDNAGQSLAVADLEHLAVTTAQAILDMACADQWEDIRTEVSDPFAYLVAYTAEAKKEANRRIDLLAHRGRRPPVVVDLKTSRNLAGPTRIDALATEVAEKYGREVAAIIGSQVACRVLWVAFDRACTWSDEKMAWPPRTQ